MMDMEQRERLVRMEAQVENLTKTVDNLSKEVEKLVTVAAMGKGAWLLILRIGAFMFAVVGVLATITTFVLDLLQRMRP